MWISTTLCHTNFNCYAALTWRCQRLKKSLCKNFQGNHWGRKWLNHGLSFIENLLSLLIVQFIFFTDLFRQRKTELIHTINQNRLLQLFQVTFVILYFSPFCGWWSISNPEFKVSEKTTVLAKHFFLACLGILCLKQFSMILHFHL